MKYIAIGFLAVIIPVAVLFVTIFVLYLMGI
jgi:hypothetical protein